MNGDASAGVLARPSATLFDLLTLLIIGISTGSLILLVCNRFSPVYAMLIGAGLVALVLACWRMSVHLSLRGLPVPLMVILLIALIFRVPPYLYIVGGQDQGIYVNMAGTYLHTGSTFIVDEVREKAVSSGLKDLYDASNQKEWRPIRKGKYEGEHLPGIYIKDTDRSTYVYQFYPLHPLWMSLSGKFLGEGRLVYSLVFFSLLSIAAFYCLALAFSGGHVLPAILIGALLAVNPLHAFFSKFPVTEAMALALSALGFLYLLWYWQVSRSGHPRPFYLILSAGLFGCLFFTRITGFLYMPIFYVLFLLALLFEQNTRLRSQLSAYVLSVMFFYGLSVFYGLSYSYPYSHDIYKSTFGMLFDAGWEKKVLVTAGAGTGLLIVAWFFRGKGGFFLERYGLLVRIRENMHWVFCGALILVVLLSLRKGYTLAYTDLYAHLRGDVGGQGWESFRRSNIFVTMLYLSPVGFGMFVYAMVRVFPQKREIPWIFLVLFLSLFWYFHTVMRFTTMYHYYYARYLLSEVVPFTLFAVCLVLGTWGLKGRWGKGWAIGLSVIMGTYFLYYTSHQFLGRSVAGAYPALKQVQERVQKGDLLLLVGIEPPLNWLIQTPLSFFFYLNTCSVKRMLDLENARGKRFLNQFDDLFVLSRQQLKVPLLDFLGEISYSAGDFEKSKSIPTLYYPFETTFYLHQAKSSLLSRKVIYTEERQEDLVNFHDVDWTNGNGIIRNIHILLDPEDRFLVLRTKGWNPFLRNHAWGVPELHVNGTALPFYSRRKDSYTYDMGGDPKVLEEIRILSPTFVPRDLGFGDDPRSLGVDVASLAIMRHCEDHLIYPYLIHRDLKNFHDTTFTDGNGIIQNIGYLLKPEKRFVILHTYGWNPFLKENRWAAPGLYLDGIRQRFQRKVGNAYVYAIEGSPEGINEIRIVSPTFVPKEQGINEDPRDLGVDVHFIEISERPPGPEVGGPRPEVRGRGFEDRGGRRTENRGTSPVGRQETEGRR